MTSIGAKGEDAWQQPQPIGCRLGLVTCPPACLGSTCPPRESWRRCQDEPLREGPPESDPPQGWPSWPVAPDPGPVDRVLRTCGSQLNPLPPPPWPPRTADSRGEAYQCRTDSSGTVPTLDC